MESYVETIFAVAFPVLGIMVLIWFIKISKLFSYLRENHPGEYTAIGEPSLFMNNTPKNNILFLRFILGTRPQTIDDPQLALSCTFLKRFFYASLAVFAILTIAVLLPILVAINAS